MPYHLEISIVGEIELQRLRILHEELLMLKLICIMMGSSFSLYLLEVLNFVMGRSNDEEIWMLKLAWFTMESVVSLYFFQQLSSMMGRLINDNVLQWMIKRIWLMIGSFVSMYLLELLNFMMGRPINDDVRMLKPICIMMGSSVSLYLFELLSSMMGRLNGDNMWIPIWELCEPIVSVYLLHPLTPMIGRLTPEHVENACKSFIRRYPFLRQEEERRQRVTGQSYALMLKIFENENEVITALLVFKELHVFTFKMIYDKIDYICRMEETA